MSTNPSSFTFKLTETQQQLLIDELKKETYEPISMPHTRVAGKYEHTRIALYNSGKCLIQGKGAQDWVLYTLEPTILKHAGTGYETALNPSLIEPHIGVDESGKGDFFGPLVIAGAYIDKTLYSELEKLGVKDSKQITSDKKSRALASEIKKVLKDKWSIVAIGPASYNRMYGSFRNLNRLLAWGHARAIENVLERVPDCPRALSDQFGPKSRVKDALMERGKHIILDQRPRAETDPAVAAASILARAAFLERLEQLQQEFGLPFPKGASAKVKEVGRDFVDQHGQDQLFRVAKLHFKTAKEL